MERIQPDKAEVRIAYEEMDKTRGATKGIEIKLMKTEKTVTRRATTPMRTPSPRAATLQAPSRSLAKQAGTGTRGATFEFTTGPSRSRQAMTIDPGQITTASQIRPPGGQPVGVSPQGLVEVYCGTLLGDIDAQPAAKELLGTALDTGGLSNADYIYNQVSALYGGVQLPDFQSPSGNGNNVKSLVFVSGSGQGGYGAFHIPGTQADFDRIVLDSLNVSGSYSAGSALGSAMALRAIRAPHLFTAYHGSGDLLGIISQDDPRF